MRKLVRPFGALVVLGLTAWLGGFGYVWSKNRIPNFGIPPRTTPPADNAYEQYEKCVSSVKQANFIFESNIYNRPIPATKADEILRDNAELISRLHALAEKPSIVTSLEPTKEFVARRDFPNVSILLKLKAQQDSRDPAKAMQALVDGLYFAEGTCRDGALMHVKTSYTCYVTLGGAFQSTISHLDSAACDDNLKRVEKLIASSTPMTEIMRNQRRVQLRILSSAVPEPGRIAKKLLFMDDYDWDYMLKPKTAAVESLNDYFVKWETEAGKLPSAVNPPQKPAALAELLRDDSIDPGQVGRHIMWYNYDLARLRLIHTALKLEQMRKKSGSYPATLAEVAQGDAANDPFTGKPFVYRRTGSIYALYSVGPNGQDDGGVESKDGSLGSKSPTDILL